MGTASGGGWKPQNGPQGRQSVKSLRGLGRSLHELLLVQFQSQRQRRLPVFLEGEARHDPQLAGTSLEDVRVTQLAVLLARDDDGLGPTPGVVLGERHRQFLARRRAVVDENQAPLRSFSR